ncbi:Pantetheinase like protein [Argiope bruennichi]|uniref:Pantetheinase like protein n=1 Tax=Argiope bruennichi TaxID=94029 RepID=A0A8T0EVU2_ARGBR|nr:Pantetheinase like protein [Argiope bruennichi]
MSPLAVLILAIIVPSLQAKPTYYTAAVFEHTGTGSKNDSTADIVKKNLDFYKRAAEIARSKGADIIVFPEYGVLPYSDRKRMKPFLENIPNPLEIETTPCSSPDRYTDRPILYTLSCIAQYNSLYVVANMGDIQNCSRDPDCPSDGTYHFNTNVVFDRSGTLLVKYHKEHPFFEQGIDIPKGKQVPIFKTDFGTFATFICFDIVFKRITEIAQLPYVEGIAFPTMWINTEPQFVSTEYFQGWAMGNNVTLLAANRQVPMEASLGSGIFDGKKGALAYTLNPDGISKLVIAKVGRSGIPKISPDASITAITANATWEWTDDGKNIPDECSMTSGYPCQKETMLQNYTFVKLNKSYGDVEACNNGLCCKLSYTSYGLKENYYLGVFNGTYNVQNTYHWCEEECLLVRCEDQNGVVCSKFPLKSTTQFHTVFLRGNFTSDFVYPSVLSSDIRLVSTKYWQQNADKSIITHNYAGINYITVGLKGRCYNKDPPFRR